MSMQVFAQIRKVDEAKRLVFGQAAAEVVDHAGEIMDYASSKPNFQKWSADVEADSGGKSLGNLRAMHGKVAAGKLVGIEFLDDKKAIDICTKVVDDAEWKKVLEGVYTGFSMGGSYASNPTIEKVDGKDVKRYTAIPTEISLVDRPCIPTAKFFDIQKMDGSVAQVAFKEPDPLAKQAEAADDGESIQGTPEEVSALCKVMNDKGLSLADVLANLEKVAARSDVNPKEGTSEYGQVAFADARNKKYPIDTAEHIRAAWNYINKGKNAGKYSAKDVAAIKSRIVGAWKKHIDKEGPPSAEKIDEATDLEKMDKVEFTTDLRKSLCGCLCGVLDQLMYLRQSAAYEAFQEGDNSPLPGRIDAVIALTATVLQEAVGEAVAEIKAGTEAGGGEAGEMEMAEVAGLLRKAHDAPLLALLKAEPEAALRAAGEEIAKLLAPKDAALSADAALAKLVSDAIAPLQKQLEAAASKIDALEKQPAPARVSLRAVAKSADTVAEHHEVTGAEVKPVLDGMGKANEAATLIKAIHQQGGRPMLRMTK